MLLLFTGGHFLVNFRCNGSGSKLVFNFDFRLGSVNLNAMLEREYIV